MDGTSTTIKCQHCGSENPTEEVYCYSCGDLLNPLVNPNDTTSVLRDETAPVTPKRRWGTARFDLETVLTLQARDYDSDPLRVTMHETRIIGRTHKDYTPDVDLGPFDAYDRGVSRQHAMLKFQNDTVVIVDMHSANSTFLNGQRLVPDQPRILRDGDEIRLGQLVLRVSFEDVIKSTE